MQYRSVCCTFVVWRCLPRAILQIHSCLVSQGCGMRVLVRSVYTPQSLLSSSSFLSSMKDVTTWDKTIINTLSCLLCCATKRHVNTLWTPLTGEPSDHSHAPRCSGSLLFKPTQNQRPSVLKKRNRTKKHCNTIQLSKSYNLFTFEFTNTQWKISF